MALSPKELEELRELEELEQLETRYGSSDPKPLKSIPQVISEKVMAPIKAIMPSSDVEPKEDSTTYSDALLGAQEGVTLGGAGELSGAIGSGMDFLHSAAHRFAPETFSESPTQVARRLAKAGFQGDIGPKNRGELYQEFREDKEQELSEASERSPYAFGAGELAGGVLAGVATPLSIESAGLSKVLTTTPLRQAAKSGIGALGKEMGKRAIIAAPAGALYGALGSEEKIVGGDEESKQKLLQKWFPELIEQLPYYSGGKLK